MWPVGGATVKEKLSDAGVVDGDTPIAIVPVQHRAGTARSTWHGLVVLLPLGRTVERGVLELRAKARRMRDRHRIELIAIDYLQLCRSTSRRGQDNRQIEIAEISSGIKALAKELEIPIIVLAQLNRQPEQRGGGKPRMSDLRESGSLEQDADVVALLVRPEVYEEDEDARSEMAGKAELLIAKQRNGPIGEIPLTFIKEYTRFENAAFDRPSGSEE